MKKYEPLVYQELGQYILRILEENPPKYQEFIVNKSTEIVFELQELFLNEALIADDYYLVDEIVSVLNKHGIRTGNCHS